MPSTRCCSTSNREPYDIEDLGGSPPRRRRRRGRVQLPRRAVLAKDAHLIFGSYNYVLDSRIRSGLKLTDLLRGAIVIIDEAHNVEETARESGSADLGSAALSTRCSPASPTSCARAAVLPRYGPRLLPC